MTFDQLDNLWGDNGDEWVEIAARTCQLCNQKKSSHIGVEQKCLFSPGTFTPYNAVPINAILQNVSGDWRDKVEVPT